MTVKSFRVWIGLALLIGLTAAATRSAIETVGMPFAGILPYKNLFVGAFTQTVGSETKLGLGFHDRIVDVDGRELASAVQLEMDIRTAMEEGKTSVRMGFVRDGSRTEHEMDLVRLTAGDVFSIFAPLLFAGLGFLLIGLLAALIQPAPAGISPFLALCWAAGTYLLTGYDFHTTYRYVPLLLTAFAFLPATVLHLAVSFPSPLKRLRGIRRWIGLFYALSAGLLAGYWGLFAGDPEAWKRFEYALFFYLSAAYVVWTAVMIRRTLRDADPILRRQCRVILFALIPAFGAVFAIGWLGFLFGFAVPFNWAALACVVFPAAIAYAMLRQNLFLVEQLERQVDERTRALKAAQAELAQAGKLAAVGVLSAGTAHEIGNAMNLIASNLPVLERYTEKLLALVEAVPLNPQSDTRRREADYDFMREDLPELVSNLRKGVERAVRIVEDLKSFSKPSTDERGPVNLPDLVDTTLRLLKGRIPPGVWVEKDFGPVGPVQASRGQIQQVLLNLILNSVEAIAGEGRVRISIQAEGSGVLTRVEDNGRGMSPDQVARVFEPFFTTKESGTGLGLSVSYGIIAAHGGDLRISSEPGKGTEVRMLLPAAEV